MLEALAVLKRNLAEEPPKSEMVAKRESNTHWARAAIEPEERRQGIETEGGDLARVKREGVGGVVVSGVDAGNGDCDGDGGVGRGAGGSDPWEPLTFGAAVEVVGVMRSFVERSRLVGKPYFWSLRFSVVSRQPRVVASGFVRPPA